MKRQIGVGDPKNVIVFDPLFTGHVIQRMRSGPHFQWCPVEDVIAHYSRTNRRSIFQLDGRVGHVTCHVRQLFKVKRSQGHVTYQQQERNISAVDGHINFKLGNYHRAG